MLDTVIHCQKKIKMRGNVKGKIFESVRLKVFFGPHFSQSAQELNKSRLVLFWCSGQFPNSSDKLHEPTLSLSGLDFP